MSARILVVDDSIYERQLVCDHLARAGYEIIGFGASGPEAVMQYRDLQPDLVTLDLVLPYLSGVEAAELIRSEAPNARIMAITGLLQPSVQAAALRAGFRAIVGKPVDPDELLNEVRELLAR